MSKARYRDITPTINELPLVPTAEDLLKHETESLERVARLDTWPRALHSWRENAIAASRHARKMGEMELHLRFIAPDPRAGASDPPHSIELGVRITGGKSPFISYGFAIGSVLRGGKFQGLRKLHFDFELTPDPREPKPIVHLQTPGRTWPALSSVGYDSSDFALLKPKLDKPRIPCLPMSFAILAHIALLEYVSVDSQIAVFVKSAGWLSSVAASETYLLKAFLSHSLAWLGKSENSSSSLISYFYRYAQGSRAS